MVGKSLGGRSFTAIPDVLGVPLCLPTAGEGVLVQSKFSVVAAQSGTTVLAFANTTPLVTNGTQVWSQAITPKFTTSRVTLKGNFSFDCGTNGRSLTIMLFRGSVCIGVTTALCTTAGRPVPVSFQVSDTPGVVTAQTYSVRVALNSSGTWYVNQSSTPYFNGMLARNGVTVTELS